MFTNRKEAKQIRGKESKQSTWPELIKHKMKLRTRSNKLTETTKAKRTVSHSERAKNVEVTEQINQNYFIFHINTK